MFRYSVTFYGINIVEVYIDPLKFIKKRTRFKINNELVHKYYNISDE